MKTMYPLPLLALLCMSFNSPAQITVADNGLSTVTSGTTVAVGLGGMLNNGLTTIDFGSSNSSSSLLFKKGSNNYFSISNNGNIGIGTGAASARLHVKGLSRFDNDSSAPFISMHKNGINVAEINAFSGNVNASIYIGKDAGVGADEFSNGNVALGTKAMYRMEQSNDNIAIGASALSHVTICIANTVVGAHALTALEGSSLHNTAIGYAALQEKKGGWNNTAVGSGTGYYNTYGANNTFIGFSAGMLSYGSGNIFVGYGAGSSTGWGDYNVIIGSNGGGLNGLSNHVLLADGQGNERLLINNKGAYNISGSYGVVGQVLTSNGNGAAPSWQASCCNGAELSDNQAVLLKRIDELAAYVIDLNKKLEQLRAENETLKKQQPR